jgi:hypothetical protein
MFGHAPETARASCCENAAAFAVEQRNPRYLKISWQGNRAKEQMSNPIG